MIRSPSQTLARWGVRRFLPAPSMYETPIRFHRTETNRRPFSSGKLSHEKRNKPSVDKRQPGAAFPTEKIRLKHFRSSIYEMLERLSESAKQQTSDDMNILQETRQILTEIVRSADEGMLNPYGKYGKEISKLMEVVLYIFSQTVDGETRAVYGDCKVVLQALQEWNLDIRSTHYDYAISVANQERRWQKASDLFWQQIDPGAGYNPVHISVANPRGLYAIARRAQEETLPVAETVFDAVTQLTMVSPSDQAKYILAAGTALGQAREWKAAIQFLEENQTHPLRKTLIASVMQACLICRRPKHALKVFEQNFGNKEADIEKEWQWGGDSDTPDALCRDLAMRAIGSRAEMDGRAGLFFHQALDEGVSISHEALLGVLQACEQEDNVDLALSVFLELLSGSRKKGWIVRGTEMSIRDLENESEANAVGLTDMGDVVATLLRTLNSSSNFGLSIVCLRLLGYETSRRIVNEPSGVIGSGHGTGEDLLPTLLNMSSQDALLRATMVAYSGLRCHGKAVKLYDGFLAEERRTEQFLLTSHAKAVHAYCLFQHRRHVPIHNQWINACKQLTKLFELVYPFKKNEVELPLDKVDLVRKEASLAMALCTDARQPQLSLFLSSWVKDNFLPTPMASDSFSSLRQYLGIGQGSDDERETSLENDALLAQEISAHRWNKERQRAVDLFLELLDSKSGELDKWSQSCDAGFSALVANDQGGNAVEIFNAMDASTLSPLSYVSIARFLLARKKFEDLDALYHQARASDSLSEDLCVLAMTGIIASDVHDRLSRLRRIVDAISEKAGMEPSNWLKSRYWVLKKELGFHHARLLMWWNDPKTCQLEELNFCIEDFQRARQHGETVEKESLKAIVKCSIAGFDDQNPPDGLNLGNLPTSIDDWRMLLAEVGREARISPLHFDASFAEDIVAAYKNLDSPKGSLEHVAGALASDVRLKRSTLRQALELVEEDADDEFAHDVKMLMQEV